MYHFSKFLKKKTIFLFVDPEMNSIMVDQKTGKHIQSNTPMLMEKNTFQWIYIGNRQQPIGFPFIFVEKKTLSRNQYKVYGDKGNHLDHQQGEFLSPSFNLIVNL